MDNNSISARESRMPILTAEQAQSIEELEATLEEPRVPSGPEGEDLTLQELYDRVFIEEELYIVVLTADVSRIRRGLSDIKNKRNSKLKKNDINPERGVLKFTVLEDVELPEGRVRLHVYLDKGETVRVFGITVADGELG